MGDNREPLESKEITDFGYQAVLLDDKTKRVSAVFDSVANRYDLMNDLMSFGLHHWWKKFTVLVSRVKEGDKVLDVATGTGDLARHFIKRVGGTGQVCLVDINKNMLSIGRDRLLNEGLVANTVIIQADAEDLPLPNRYFDYVSLAFGLRNIARKNRALLEAYRVLKPGGQLLLLEFSTPRFQLMQTIYDAYSFDWLPKLGSWIAKASNSYQYLVESIRCHPDQDVLRNMVLEAGFDHCDYYNLTGGIVALHRAWKC